MCTTRVEEPRALKTQLPKIIIYGLNKALTKDELSESITAQNKCLGEGFELKFPIKGKQGQTHWMAEITPDKLSEIRKRGKISIGLSIHSFRDYLWETKCFWCYRLVQFRAKCLEKEELCAQCGEPGHQLRACQAQEEKCINCIKANGHFKLKIDVKHSSLDRQARMKKQVQEICGSSCCRRTKGELENSTRGK